MKKLSIILLTAAMSTGCATTPRAVEHSEHGTLYVKDELHVQDVEGCVADYVDTQATTDEEKAEGRANYENRTFGFKTLVAGIVVGHALKTGDESSIYVDKCMTDKGWVTW